MSEKVDVETGARGGKTRDATDPANSFQRRMYQEKEHKSRVPSLLSGFVLGVSAVLVAQYAVSGSPLLATTRYAMSPSTVEHLAAPRSMPTDAAAAVLAAPYAGSTSVHHYPPAHPTNAYPSLFPSNVGLAGGTPTGGEPGLAATAPAYPMNTGQCSHELVPPARLEDLLDSQEDESADVEAEARKRKFNIFQNWGTLSPWFSIKPGHFGVKSTAAAPETCRITGLHLLHRHGARYPTGWSSPNSYGGPATFAKKLHTDPSSWNASGVLSFLNDWTYKLGEEVLTPFGRQQLYNLGVSMRLKYGFLLENFTETNTIPVFRTESQDRMVNSAVNFALGFFGHPLEGKYQQSITLEGFQKDGTPYKFNNTLAPYSTCKNFLAPGKGDRADWYFNKWVERYTVHAQKRLQTHMHGMNLTINDVYTMQQLCAYETVALGYSKFCELFTEEEWKDFDYSQDLQYWYGSAFGSPIARAQGVGYLQELIARLTHTPIAVHNSTTNSTLDDNEITFPLHQSLYVDATHEVVVTNVITALNLTSFAMRGPLPYTHRPKERSFRAAELAPFATNVQFQVLECASHPDPQIRVIVNDGVAPLTGIKGCHHQKDGMCSLPTFIAAQKQTIAETDWAYDCCGNWTIPEGDEWYTTTGSPPKQEGVISDCSGWLAEGH